MKTKNSSGNGFDAIRLAAAFLVLISHAFPLSGQDYEPFRALTGAHTLGNLGVCIFFSISGYLVTQSWLRDPHPGRYLIKRSLRIFPALVVVVMLSVFVLGPIMTRLSTADYFAHPNTFTYLWNMTLWRVQYMLPGVFKDVPYPNAVNGSLWTLPVEFAMYLILPVAAIVARATTRWSLLAALGACVYLDAIIWAWKPLAGAGSFEAMHYLPRLGCFFFAGALFAHFSRQTVERLVWLGAATFALSFFALRTPWYMHLSIVYVPCLAIGLGCREAPSFLRPRMDISYGVYLYAFPVQQLFMSAWPDAPIWIAILAPIPPTLLLAWASWKWVERPMLQLKSWRGLGLAKPAVHVSGAQPVG